MRRTGYQRPWYKASKHPYYSGNGPAYVFMHMTIGSWQAPIVGAGGPW